MTLHTLWYGEATTPGDARWHTAPVRDAATPGGEATTSRRRGEARRFVIDAGVLLHLAERGLKPAPGNELLAPTLIRSEVLSRLHEAVHRGELPDDVARARLEVIWRLRIRLLGDAVLRRRAWDLATRFGWASTHRAEYVALTQLQGDALVTLDEELARAVDGVVQLATIGDLT